MGMEECRSRSRARPPTRHRLARTSGELLFVRMLWPKNPEPWRLSTTREREREKESESESESETETETETETQTETETETASECPCS